MKLRITWDSIKEHQNEEMVLITDRDKIRENMIASLRHWKEEIDATDLPKEKKALIVYGDILDKQIDILKTRHNINRILQGNENHPDKIELKCLTGDAAIDWTKSNLWNVLFFDKIALHLMRLVSNELNGSRKDKEDKPKKVRKPRKPKAEKAEKTEKSEKPAKKAKADKKTDAAAQKILERVEEDD